MIKKIRNFQTPPNIVEMEEDVLNHWDSVNAFNRSVSQRSANNPFIFYDGPPFATGTPHYGHILASTIKDTVPRYWSMKGYRVERVWGWDCHGLPIENMIEQELDLQGGKLGIEKLGIDKFNAACRSAILRFEKDWEKIIRRMGRWVDFKNSYKTMDNSYMESVWWAFKELYSKDLVYEGKKVILYCPRCATPLSNFEIAMDNSYKDVVDNSIFVKFKIKNTKSEFFVAWTTTPWTLIGNVALAVNKKAQYIKVKMEGEELWVAENLAETVFKKKKNELNVINKKDGLGLVGMEYESLYDYMPTDDKKLHYVVNADFVSLEEGTGIVHTAAIFGEDDYKLALEYDLPCESTLDDQGKFLSFVTPLSGVFYKKAEDWIINDLEKKGLLYRFEKTTHSYPFCYRCNTPLYFNAIPAWFINIQKIKKNLIEQNEKIKWYPEYLKHGRFGKGLEQAPDWNVSRSRYWGTPIPIWQDKKTGTIRVIGSMEDLKKWAVVPSKILKINDYHREFLDPIEVWVDDKKTIKGKRIPEVFDCWVESGSMPFASIHYPFENKKKFEKSYPAQFISEYIAQTRAWFYTLHALSVGLFNKQTFENAVATGTIMAEDGSKMSKSKKNYPDPMLIVDKYGVDALRLYLMSSPLMKAENLDFNSKGVEDIRRGVLNIWWNIFAFYKIYTTSSNSTELPKTDEIEHVMDRWIASKIQHLTKSVTESMDQYDIVTASRSIILFIDEFSTRYLRESRERLKDIDTNKQAVQVFGAVLKRLALLAAPIIPFLTEVVYQNIVDKPQDSVHLEDWPLFDSSYFDPKLEDEVEIMYRVAEKAHSFRKDRAIKVRQPLSSVEVESDRILRPEILEVLKLEINVEEVIWTKARSSTLKVKLNTEISEDLRQKGEAREIVRLIQNLRKEVGVKFDEMIKVQLKSWPEKLESQIKIKTFVSEITKGDEDKIL